MSSLRRTDLAVQIGARDEDPHGNLAAMTARLLPDGSCELIDRNERMTWWPSATAWADQWLEEWRRHASGPASEFIGTMTKDATPGVLNLVRILAERAATGPDSQELSWVGAGPFEDLLSHTGNGGAVLNEVEQLYRSHVAFRIALSNVWLGHAVHPQVRSRLVALGARDVAKPQA